MTRLNLRGKTITLLAASGLLVVACGGSDDPVETNKSAAATGGSAPVLTAGTGGSAPVGPIAPVTPMGGSTGSTACDGKATVGGMIALIDDFELADREPMGEASIPSVDGRTGSWFTSSDDTQGGMQTPEATKPYPTADAGYLEGDGFASTGSGWEDWGALFGVSLNDNGGNGCAYDASAFDGITFWAKSGDGTEQEITVGVPIPAVIPAERGGACTATVGCDDTHVKVITVTATWQEFKISWSELKQDTGWAEGQKFDFDAKNIAQITFAKKTIWKPEPADILPVSYNIVIDDLAFMGGTPGAGGATNN